MAHPTELKKNAFRLQHRREFQKTKITSQFIRLKNRFVATFSTKKSSQMGAFFRSQCPLAIRFLVLAHIKSSETIL